MPPTGPSSRGGRSRRANFNGALFSGTPPSEHSSVSPPPGFAPPKIDLPEGTSPSAPVTNLTPPPEPAEGESPVCFICAEKGHIWSIGACSHRMCHVCSVRLRALYKNRVCQFCKEPLPHVLFTNSATEPYQSYHPDASWPVDDKLAIQCETPAILNETMSLLRFKCRECEYVASGWAALKAHVRDVHRRQLCDLCVKHKKVFAHEHAFYTDEEMRVHKPPLPSTSARAKKVIKNKDSHPGCDFCFNYYYDDDQLYAHMRDLHEECFLCKAAGIRYQYFRNYADLEQHFTDDHYPCMHPSCVEKKFIVFNSDLDLRAHQVEEHGGELSARARRDAARIEVPWDSSTSSAPRGSGAGGRGGRGGGGAGAAGGSGGRAPPQTASTRRANFGATLTQNAMAIERPVLATDSAPPSGTATPIDGSASVDPEAAARHAALMARVQQHTSSENDIHRFKFAVRSFRANESTPRDFVQGLLPIFKNDVDVTGRIVSGLIDLFDDADKKRALLQAWKTFKVERRDAFPSLGGAGPSNYANPRSTGGRVPDAAPAPSRPAGASSGNRVWDRVDRVASASSGRGSGPVPVVRQNISFPALSTNARPAASSSSTPWAGGAASRAAGPPPASAFPSPAASAAPKRTTAARPPPAASFPALPSSAAVAQAQAERRALFNRGGSGSGDAEAGSCASVWSGPSRDVADGVGALSLEGSNANAGWNANGRGGNNKRKGKQKQTLFTFTSR